ncbi:UNVERIFIED_CONTAM: hypothetical protein HDU68_002268 [Siphonaria sp. JEL0065]|nr:hypothetical protein HDU68_002268 [Siphonaria sp. JEL0065]
MISCHLARSAENEYRAGLFHDQDDRVGSSDDDDCYSEVDFRMESVKVMKPVTISENDTGAYFEPSFADEALNNCLKPGSGTKPYVATCLPPRQAESEFDALDFDDFLDDLMASLEIGVQSFLKSCDVFSLVGLWSGISLIDFINPSPLRADWIAFCLFSVKALHRSVRASIFMIAILLLFFTISNTLLLAMFGLPYGPQILSTVTSMVIYCHVAFCMGPQKTSSWGAVSVFVVADFFFKNPPTSDKQFMAGAHCISYAFFGVISKGLEVSGKRNGVNKSTKCGEIEEPANVLAVTLIDSDSKQVEVHLQHITADQAIFSWFLPRYTLSDLCAPPDFYKGMVKTSIASDLAAKSSSLNRPMFYSRMDPRFKKQSSKVPVDWDCLIFRGVPPSNAILAVTASDISVKINGALCTKAEMAVNIKNRTVSVKLCPHEEFEILLVVAGLESDVIRLVTPKRPLIEKQRKANLNSKLPVYRSIGVSAIDPVQLSTETATEIVDEATAALNANLLIISELTKDLDTLQTHYKSSQTNLRRLRREYTRSTCNLKSEIEMAEGNITKDIATEYKTKQKFQSIQESISATEIKINKALSEIKMINAAQNSVKETEVKCRQNVVNSLKDALKIAEKGYTKSTSQMAKITTVTVAEITALQKILEDGQKELKSAEIEILNLKSNELMEIESQVDSAWCKQTEIKEISDQQERLREVELDEKKAVLDKIRLQCESVHAKNTELEQIIKEKRISNDKICEELMLCEDKLLKSDQGDAKLLKKQQRLADDPDEVFWNPQSLLDDDDYDPYA